MPVDVNVPLLVKSFWRANITKRGYQRMISPKIAERVKKKKRVYRST